MSSIRSTPRERGNEARRDAGGEALPARRSRRWAPLAVLLTGLIIVTTGCTSNAFTRMGLPVPVTKQGAVVLTMWQGSWIAAWATGIVVWGGILWAIIFHRKRGNQLPQQVRYNLPIEILYTVLPFIMVGVLFYFTARDENYIDKIPAHPQVTVNVTGFQWSWQFQYPGYKVPGNTGADSVVTETGAMWNPTAAVQHLPLLAQNPRPRDREVQPHLDRRDPRVLGGAVRVQAGRNPGVRQSLCRDRDQDRLIHRAMYRAVRGLSQPDALQDQDCLLARQVPCVDCRATEALQSSSGGVQ